MAAMTPALLDAMRRINELLRVGSFRAAHDQLETILAANPGFVEALRLLAGTKQALGDAAAAEELLLQALTLDPNWTPTLATLGELLLSSGRASEAEPLLRRAVEGLPPVPRAALLLARYYNDTGRPTLAVAVAAPLCVSGKADAELAAQHIAALAALGREEEAVTGYRNLVTAAPNNLTAAHALAIALNVTGRHTEAERVAHHVLSRGYKTAALYHTYARSLLARSEEHTSELQSR